MALRLTTLSILIGLVGLACGDSSVQPLPPGSKPGPSVSDIDTQGQTYRPAPPIETGPSADIVPAVPRQSGLEVVLDSGPVRGAPDGDLRIFRGIPFAAPPVDELRFRPPVPVEPWDETLDASEFGPTCPQADLPIVSASGEMSEDCLNANVWAHNDERTRPVMVWIYGGAFIIGGGDWIIYEASELAKRGDVVVVTFNYRLGALGFLATEALQDSDPLGQIGNAGFLDIIEVLRWIRRNAPAFGGDPYNVTVFGESAGGMSVCALLGAPMADGLFKRGISQSGGGCNVFAHLDQPGAIGVPPALQTGREIVEAVGCDWATDQVACLRRVPAQDFVDAIPLGDLFTDSLARRLRVVPVVDGVVLREMPIDRMKRGATPADVSAVFGSNTNEAVLFTALDTVFSHDDFRNKLLEVRDDPALAEAVVALYPSDDYLLAKDAYTDFIGDVVFNCGTLAAAEALGERGRVYYFDHAPLLMEPLIGTMHAVDTLYLFGNFSSLALIPTEADNQVSDLLQDAWTSYATVGSPYFPGGWPAYAPGDPSIAHIADRPELLAEIRSGRCQSLRALGVVP